MSGIRVPGLAAFWAQGFLLVNLPGLQSIGTEFRVYSLFSELCFWPGFRGKVQRQGSKV